MREGEIGTKFFVEGVTWSSEMKVVLLQKVGIWFGEFDWVTHWVASLIFIVSFSIEYERSKVFKLDRKNAQPNGGETGVHN